MYLRLAVCTTNCRCRLPYVECTVVQYDGMVGTPSTMTMTDDSSFPQVRSEEKLLPYFVVVFNRCILKIACIHQTSNIKHRGHTSSVKCKAYEVSAALEELWKRSTFTRLRETTKTISKFQIPICLQDHTFEHTVEHSRLPCRPPFRLPCRH